MERKDNMSKRRIKGQIVSAKMDKTVVVAVEMPKKHPLYGKLMRNTRKFKAHNEMNVSEGDYVIIEETKPFSKEVTWIVIEKITSKEAK